MARDSISPELAVSCEPAFLGLIVPAGLDGVEPLADPPVAAGVVQHPVELNPVLLLVYARLNLCLGPYPDPVPVAVIVAVF